MKPKSQKSLRIARGLALTAVTAMFAAGCAATPPADAPGTGVVKAGVADQPPYSGLNTQGEVIGLGPDVANRVLEMMDGGNLEGIVAAYADLIPGLNANRWDMIAASLHISAPRCEQVLFADPILLESASFAVLPGNPSDVSSLDELVTSGQNVAILTGSFLVPLAKSHGVPASQIIEFPDGQGALEGLEAGRVQAVLSSSTAFDGLADVSEVEFDVVGPLPDVEPSGSSVAFKKGDEDLRDKFNEKLREMKASGALSEILEKNGFAPYPEGYLDYTFEDACEVPF